MKIYKIYFFVKKIDILPNLLLFEDQVLLSIESAQIGLKVFASSILQFTVRSNEHSNLIQTNKFNLLDSIEYYFKLKLNKFCQGNS